MSIPQDCLFWPAHAMAEAVRTGDVSARELARAHLDRIERLNGALGAYTDVTTDRALAKADAIDAARARGETLPPFAGAPFAAKNLYDIAGLVTRAGSKINRDNAPATQDATLVARLEAAGAPLLGALNMGEYAYDFTGLNAHDGPACNPHDPARMTGGSSSGSAAAAAGGLASVALGSDTNGSIRVPASLCGLFGMKPTYGALSRAGTFPFVSSLDHLGPLARSVRDLALAYDAMRGPDPRDPLSNPHACEQVATLIERRGPALRIAIADDYFARGATPEAYAAVAAVAGVMGATETVTLPQSARARAAAYLITMVEGAALHLERMRTRIGDFDPDVRDRLIAGAMLPGHWVVRAQKFRRWYRAAVLALFERTDAILAPATPCVAPLRADKTFVLDGVELPIRPNMGIFTQPLSFIGLPVVTVPTWTDRGLPIGVQIIAAPGREDVALRIAWQVERAGVAGIRIP